MAVFPTSGLCQSDSQQVLEEFLWSECFDSNKLSTQRIRTITQSHFHKLPLKPIIKTRSKITFWELNKDGKVTMNYNTVPLNDTLVDTTACWNFYKNNRLSMTKKTGIAGIVVKVISYQNDLPIRFIYGKSKNNSGSKIELQLDSYHEGRSEYLEHTQFGDGNHQTTYKSSDGVVFKIVLSESLDSNMRIIRTQFPYQSEKDFTIEKNENHDTFKSITIKKKNEVLKKYVFTYDLKLTEFETFETENEKSLSHTELIYEEATGLLQAILTKNLQNEEIHITKYHYTYYE